MAATLPFSFCLDSSSTQQSLLLKTHFFKPHQTLFSTQISPKPTHPLLLLHKTHHRCNLHPLLCTSHSPSESILDRNPFGATGFLTTPDVDKLQILENYQYFHEFESGSLWVRVMQAEEMDVTAGLLAESFGESMGLPMRFVNVLAFLVKQYMTERRALMPNTATLIGFYRDGDGEEELAGTVEVSFNKKGSNASPPSPTPPRESPYICNMTVRKQLRRRGIGWHLLRACEDLISQMSNASSDLYLHCRMIDTVPFNMYAKAGYNVVKTDSILILLTLQRRKHLMCKKLQVLQKPSESDSSGSEVHLDHQDQDILSEEVMQNQN